MVTFKLSYDQPLTEAEELRLEAFYTACDERGWDMLEERMKAAITEERFILIRAMLNAFDDIKGELPDR